MRKGRKMKLKKITNAMLDKFIANETSIQLVESRPCKQADYNTNDIFSVTVTKHDRWCFNTACGSRFDRTDVLLVVSE